MKKRLFTLTLAASVTLSGGMLDQAANLAKSAGVDTKAVSGLNLNNELLSTLTKQLGVNPKQAAGGTATLLKAAADKMPKGSYETLLKSVPGLGAIAKNGDLLSQAGKLAGGNFSVDAAFKALGMQPDMVKQFVPVITDYAKKFAPQSAQLLQQALSAVL
ncbi:MAG: DUF2780 domain-containing protein [Epsilonproteobacteria bacterium]|nr:DUF2780 domain-containing protein [Campylobacterota bacterium]